MAVATVSSGKLPSATALAIKNLSSNQSSQVSSAATTQKTGSTLDYDAFLQLLVAELKNQDPTKPMDSAAYMAQLASFSNVEQATKTNTKLDALIAAQALSQADAVIGRTITSADGTISGKVSSVRLATGGASAILEGGQEVLLGNGVRISNQ